MWLRTTEGWYWRPQGTWRSRIQAGNRAVRRMGDARKYPVVRSVGTPWTHSMVSEMARSGDVYGLREVTTSPVLMGGILPEWILISIAR